MRALSTTVTGVGAVKPERAMREAGHDDLFVHRLVGKQGILGHGLGRGVCAAAAPGQPIASARASQAGTGV